MLDWGGRGVCVNFLMQAGTHFLRAPNFRRVPQNLLFLLDALWKIASFAHKNMSKGGLPSFIYLYIYRSPLLCPPSGVRRKERAQELMKKRCTVSVFTQ